jgi:hypothetical protein
MTAFTNHPPLDFRWAYRIFEALTDEIKAERRRQQAKWGEQNHKDAHHDAFHRSVIGTGDEAKRLCEEHFEDGVGTWLDILLEEVAEAADEAYRSDTEKLRTELIQVAAVVVAWIEAIDRRAS